MSATNTIYLRPFRFATIVFIAGLIGLDVMYLAGNIDWWWILVWALLYLHLLVLGAIYIQWNFFLVSYNKGANSNRIALTFDDGPATETNRILDVLKAHGVQATFFTIGKRAAANPDMVKRWHDEGHLIGNHSYLHGFNFDWKSTASMVAELQNTNETVHAIAGVTPRLFRPPYGVTNPNVANAVKRTGMYSIGWNVRSFDTKATDGRALINRIVSRLQGGDIILLHDSMPITAEILTDLIVQARQKGFTFARVDTLLGIEPYA